MKTKQLLSNLPGSYAVNHNYRCVPESIKYSTGALSVLSPSRAVTVVT